LQETHTSEAITNEHYLMANENTLSDLGAPGSVNSQIAKDLNIMLTPTGGGLADFSKMFTIAYLAIKNANLLISRIDDISWDDKTKRNAMVAEAYFFRSYWYYRLINTFGDVPFLGQEITAPKLDFYTHSRSAILKKIISDMEFAIQWLPVSAVPGAISKGAGDHLLTKIYLSSSDFDKAIESANRVINGPYALMKTRFGSVANDPKRNVIWDLFRPENISIPQNTETILATIDRYEAPVAARSKGCRKSRSYAPAWFGPKVLDSQGKSGTEFTKPATDTLLYSNAMSRMTPFYIYEIWSDGTYYWNNTPDLRRSKICWVNKEQMLYNRTTSVDFGKPINPKYFAAQTDTFQYYFSFPQYKIFYPEHDPSNTLSQGGNGDAYIFRLAETYLLRAEAYFWKGDLINAAKDINEVRGRANATPVLPANVTIDYIMDERARELFSEEPRHNELTRVSYILAQNNLGGYTKENFSKHNYYYDRVIQRNIFFRTNYYYGGTYRISPWHVLWPIPNTIITANTMGIINQNQGYFGSENNIPPLETIEGL